MSEPCKQGDPHCGVNYGDKCERGCFNVTVETDEFERLVNIEKCALNLIKVKGRHNSEIAMCRLIAACEKE